MLELTDTARKELEAYFADKKKATIRIYAAAGCCGPRLALALDEPDNDDHAEESHGFNFCIKKDLLGQIQGVKVDLTYMGFAVEPLVPLEGGGSSACGGCSSAAGCGG
ncbi:MAG: IscA/HesB family protein [Desulfovibrio sp.]|jgi:Fe-S cluster assembly iron-binding protein IscA|nr:IscA/HesB family protein [Desulfovibrio sp.]